jgi:hypothetical protein
MIDHDLQRSVPYAAAIACHRETLLVKERLAADSNSHFHAGDGTARKVRSPQSESNPQPEIRSWNWMKSRISGSTRPRHVVFGVAPKTSFRCGADILVCRFTGHSCPSADPVGCQTA